MPRKTLDGRAAVVLKGKPVEQHRVVHARPEFLWCGQQPADIVITLTLLCDQALSLRAECPFSLLDTAFLEQLNHTFGASRSHSCVIHALVLIVQFHVGHVPSPVAERRYGVWRYSWDACHGRSTVYKFKSMLAHCFSARKLEPTKARAGVSSTFRPHEASCCMQQGTTAVCP
jgi:hypothetical protein